MHAGSLESTRKASVALRQSHLATLRFSRALQTSRVHRHNRIDASKAFSFQLNFSLSDWFTAHRLLAINNNPGFAL